MSEVGSSPHTRDKSPSSEESPSSTRIIPAYAGQIKNMPSAVLEIEDHPRIRGTN